MGKSNVECIRAFREAVSEEIAFLESAAAGLQHVIDQGESKPGGHRVALESITKITDMIEGCIDIDMRPLLHKNIMTYLPGLRAADSFIPERHLRSSGYVQNLFQQIDNYAPAVT